MRAPPQEKHSINLHLLQKMARHKNPPGLTLNNHFSFEILTNFPLQPTNQMVPNVSGDQLEILTHFQRYDFNRMLSNKKFCQYSLYSLKLTFLSDNFDPLKK